MNDTSQSERRKAERRLHVRVPEENRVTIMVTGEGGVAERVIAFTRDLSIGGAQVLTDRRFPSGTELTLTLVLSKTGQLVEVPGKVQWASEVEPGLYALGFRFHDTVPESRLALMEHLFRQAGGIPSLLKAL